MKAVLGLILLAAAATAFPQRVLYPLLDTPSPWNFFHRYYSPIGNSAVGHGVNSYTRSTPASYLWDSGSYEGSYPGVFGPSGPLPNGRLELIDIEDPEDTFASYLKDSGRYEDIIELSKADNGVYYERPRSSYEGYQSGGTHVSGLSDQVAIVYTHESPTFSYQRGQEGLVDPVSSFLLRAPEVRPMCGEKCKKLLPSGSTIEMYIECKIHCLRCAKYGSNDVNNSCSKFEPFYYL